jgi:hypothetical protein
MKRTRERAGKGIFFFFVVFTFLLLNSFETAGGPQKAEKERMMSQNEEIMAVLSCMGYGYNVKVLVNGTDVGIKGGMSESKRLFDKNSEMAAQATPEIRKKNFVLVKGPNTISVEFTKQGSNQHDKVELTLEVENYPAPLFKLETSKSSGKVEKTITIQSQAPANFKTVTAD